MAFDVNIDYQEKINKLKAADPNDPKIAELIRARNEKIASDPTKYMKYADDPEAVYKIEAENIVSPEYDLNTQTLNKKYAALKEAKEAEKESVDTTYDRYIDNTEDKYKKSRSSAKNEALNRGFGRSSYIDNTLSDIRDEKSKEIDDIEYDKDKALSSLDDEISQLDLELSQNINELNFSKAKAIAAKMDELRAKQQGLQYGEY